MCFFLRTKIENLVDQKWSADRTLGNTAINTHIRNKIVIKGRVNLEQLDHIDQFDYINQYVPIIHDHIRHHP
jgi:hypothetical protein